MPRPRHRGTVQPARGRARSRELSPDVDVGVEQTLGRGIRLSRIEGAERPPHVAAGVRGLAQARQGRGSRPRPGRSASAAPAVAALHAASRNSRFVSPSVIARGDGRAPGRRARRPRPRAGSRRGSRAGRRAAGSERLHALDRDALGHLLEHAARVPGNSSLQLALRAGAHPIGQQQLPALRRTARSRHVAGKRSLIGDRERADLVDLIAEELDTIADACAVGGKTSRMPPRTANSPRRETMSTRWYASSTRRDETSPSRGPTADVEVDRSDIGQPRRERLDGAPHRRCDLRGESSPCHLATWPEHLKAGAHDLGARAQPLVRERLPRREVQHLGAGKQRAERGAERLGAAPGGCDHQEGSAVCPRRGGDRCRAASRGASRPSTRRSPRRRGPQPGHRGTVRPVQGRARSRELSPEESRTSRRHRTPRMNA